nr:DUF443 family protein [Lentibacillus daqui]
MNCKVQGAFKNLRYRILTIDGEGYILDTGSSFWKIVFPLFFWMFPNAVFKVDDPNITEKLKSPEVNQTKTGHSSILGAGVGIFLATLLKSLADYFALPDTPLINSVILGILVLIVLVLFAFLNHKLKKKLYRTVNLEELSIDKLWIRPKSFKHFLQGLLTYLFVLLLNTVFFYLSIAYPDVVTLFFTMVILFALLYTNIFITPVGITPVKFKGGKRTAV